MDIQIKNISDINDAAQTFVNAMGDKKIFAFYGEMGTGKTTFIKAVCKILGVAESITSPTFAIVNEYKKKDGKPVFHFDFYRIKNIEDVFDFGYEDYFYSGDICFIEWPELIEALLPDDVVKIQLTVGFNEERLISIK